MPVGPVAPTIAIFVMTGINAEHFRAYPKLGPNDPQSPYKPILRRINDGVRFGSKADIARDQLNVRFTPKSGHWARPAERARTLLLRSPRAPKGQREEIEATTSFVVTTALA